MMKYKPDDVVLYNGDRYVIRTVNKKLKYYSVRRIKDNYITWFPSELDVWSEWICRRSDLSPAERDLRPRSLHESPNKEMKWQVLRCRICGNLIGWLTEDIDYNEPHKLNSALHRHCTNLSEGESAICDMVKVSTATPKDCSDLILRVSHTTHHIGYINNTDTGLLCNIHIEDFSEDVQDLISESDSAQELFDRLNTENTQFL